MNEMTMSARVSGFLFLTEICTDYAEADGVRAVFELAAWKKMGRRRKAAD